MQNRIPLVLLWTAAAALAAEGDPRVSGVCAVAPDVLAITVDAGRGVCPGQRPYVKQPGDAVKIVGDRDTGRRLVLRGGREIGFLVGREDKTIWLLERLDGQPLDTKWADRTGSYAVSSKDHAAYAAARRPSAVHRKSKPTDMLQTGNWRWAFPVRHVIYLRLPAPLKAGAAYAIRFPGGPLGERTYRHDPAGARSEAVHVNHLGFRPDDPAKVAFLSCWMGSGGGLDYGEGPAFRVLDHRTGRKVLTGTCRLRVPAGQAEDPYKRNHNGTNVYEMDFSALAEPGTYRLCVDGVGASYPFEVRRGLYREAFIAAARGFYHQRSGIALGPPHTEYRRPRCFHPLDGVKVYHSTCPLMASGNGLNCLGTDKNNFGNLVAGRTDRLVADAWGAYMDAGDWDRRIQHLIATRNLFELYELFPAFFAKVALNIPESSDGLPDVLSEALFNLDAYRRMQTPDGGIRGGIESAEHPRTGECSWQESLTVLAYAPGAWSSYLYAATAARAARLLAPLKADLAATCRRSALRAMAFAEREYPDYAKRIQPKCHGLRDARNLAAAELFRLTGEATWHELFLKTTVFADAKAELYLWQHHDQREAAWVYVSTKRPGLRAGVQANARKAILREADAAVRIGQGAGFRWVKGNPWRPIGWGALTGPEAASLLQAHRLTGQAKYLRAAVLACQFGLGANPDNLCYTTGLGHVSPANPLVVDQRRRGVRPPPPGITVFGPMNPKRNATYWVYKLMAPHCTPAPTDWPTMEAYFDVWLFPPVTEFTIQQPMAQVAQFWGYLAARK